MLLVQVAERKLRVGFARIEQLRKRSAPQSEEAARWPQASGRPSRLFFSDRENANSASMKTRGVPASPEPVEASDSPCGAATGPGADPWPAQALYEELYCAKASWRTRSGSGGSCWLRKSASNRCRPIRCG